MTSGYILEWLKVGPPPRAIQAEYQDPLELVWLELLGEIGWRLTRSSEVFASWDGAGGLTLSIAEHMDPDDCLAQLIFHEVCHALIEGPQGWVRPDWGLENQDHRHLVNELACHRVQATLASRYGLRALLAVTTDWRPHYDALPANPMAPCLFAGPLDEEARTLAHHGLLRAETPPWRSALTEALTRTQKLRQLCAPFAPSGSIWRR